MEYDLSTSWTVLLVLLVIWEWTWKGVALWRTGRDNQLGWFVAILLINSAGILPIIYLLSHKSTPKGLHDEKILPEKG